MKTFKNITEALESVMGPSDSLLARRNQVWNKEKQVVAHGFTKITSEETQTKSYEFATTFSDNDEIIIVSYSGPNAEKSIERDLKKFANPFVVFSKTKVSKSVEKSVKVRSNVRRIVQVEVDEDAIYRVGTYELVDFIIDDETNYRHIFKRVRKKKNAQ